MKTLGPFPKSTSGPMKHWAQMIFPFPTGESSFASISIVSVSHPATLSLYYSKISSTLCASYLLLTIVVPSIFKSLSAIFTPSSSLICLPPVSIFSNSSIFCSILSLIFLVLGFASFNFCSSSFGLYSWVLLSEVYPLILSLVFSEIDTLFALFGLATVPSMSFFSSIVDSTIVVEKNL